MNFTYNYGTSATNTGRVLSRTDALQPEHSVNYYYDSLYRLGEVASNDPTTSWALAWTFDTWGNRLTQTPLGLSTTKVGTQTIGYTNNRNNANTYDAAGNATNDGLHNYNYNAENQITSMDAGTATYAYDGEGRRMKKVTATEATYTFYGPGGIISEFTTSNAIATATAASSTDKCFYHTTDKLGSAVLVMTANGTVIENNRTLPYGEAWLAENTPTTNDKKFTTYQRDSESGLDYAMNRYYASGNGRFATADSYGRSAKTDRPQTLNRYVYISNDPINGDDPSGLDPEGGPQDTCTVNGMAWPRSMCDLILGFGPPKQVSVLDRALGRMEAAQDALSNRSSISANCANDFAALSNASGLQIDLGTIQNAAAGASFANGATSNLPVSALFAGPAARAGLAFQAQQDGLYGPGQRIRDEFARNPNGLTAEAVLYGNTIYINPNLIGGSLNQNVALLMHESLHLLGMTDTAIQAALGITQDPKNTKNITNKLSKDCVSGKDNK